MALTFEDREKVFGKIENGCQYIMQLRHDSTKKIVMADVTVDDEGDEIDTKNWSAISWTKANKK